MRKPLLSDEALLRRLERATGELRPDPLYRRRLRAEVVNRHVAAREGLIERPRPQRREMGRLGRAVLYASLVTALSVTAVGAAAQDALPGDGLYPIKRQLEELRLRIAPPALRDDLLALALEERLGEVEELAARGEWQGAERAAAAASEVATRLAALGAPLDAADQARLDGHLAVLAELLARAPEAARDGLERAMDAAGFGAQHGSGGPPSGSGGPGDHGGKGSGGEGVEPGATPSPDASPGGSEPQASQPSQPAQD
jgi:hypothetical protein